MTTKLLSIGVDAKTVKGEKKGFLTGILYMAPHTIGGGESLCKFSTEGCRAVCLYTSGRGGMNNVQVARTRKSKLFREDRPAFLTQLRADIAALIKMCKSTNMTPAVRLNGTTDILWETLDVIPQFPDIQFYDYTKYPPALRPDLPPNYHITYSFSEAPHAPKWSKEWADRGFNTAAVFSGGLPDSFQGRPVIDGDDSDLRFTDPKGVVVGLKTKGKARGVVDAGTGFVQLGKAA